MDIGKITRPTVKIIGKIKPDATTALTAATCVGIVGTMITTIQATTKAEKLLAGKELPNKKEKLKVVWKCYIPPVAIAATSILCSLSANKLNKDRQAALTTSYLALRSGYNQIRRVIDEKYGEGTFNDILGRKVLDEYGYDIATDLMDGCNHSESDDDGKTLYYDEYSDRYFRATEDELLKAIDDLNRYLMLFGKVNLNTFYQLLGLDEVPIGNLYGWNWDILCNEDYVEIERIEIEVYHYYDDISNLESGIILFYTPPLSDYDK